MSISIPHLERFYLSPGKYDKDIDFYLPKKDLDLSLKERIEKHGSMNSFRYAWYRIYDNNEARIESFIRGDDSQLDKIDFNNLCYLIKFGWPHTFEHVDFYFKDPSDFTLRDYQYIANRIWAYAHYRH